VTPRLSSIRVVSLALAVLPILIGWSSPRAAESVEAIPGANESWTLDRCVQATLETNAALRAERQRLGELAAQLTQARSEGLPTVDLTGSWTKSRDPSFALDDNFITDENPDEKGSNGDAFEFSPGDITAQSSWRTSLDATWLLRPQRIWNAVQGARLAVDRQTIILQGIEYATIEEVVRAYYDVLLASEDVAATASEVETRREFLEIARRRFRVELGTELDTLQARVSLANVEPDLRRARQELQNAGSRMNILLGRSPLDPLRIDATYPIEQTRLDPKLVESRIEQRPDFLESDLQTSILRKARGAQKALHRPYLSLNGSYGFVVEDVADLGDDGYESWSARIAVVVPVFDGLLTRGRVKETEAGIRRTEHEHEELQRQAVLEVWQLKGDVDSAAETLRAAELNLEAAEEVLRRTTLRYELGKAENLDVLNAQLERFRARSILIRGRHEVLTLTASLKRALGFDPSRAWSELSLR